MITPLIFQSSSLNKSLSETNVTVCLSLFKQQNFSFCLNKELLLPLSLLLPSTLNECYLHCIICKIDVCVKSTAQFRKPFSHSQIFGKNVCLTQSYFIHVISVIKVFALLFVFKTRFSVLTLRRLTKTKEKAINRKKYIVCENSLNAEFWTTLMKCWRSQNTHKQITLYEWNWAKSQK